MPDLSRIAALGYAVFRIAFWVLAGLGAVFVGISFRDPAAAASAIHCLGIAIGCHVAGRATR